MADAIWKGCEFTLKHLHRDIDTLCQAVHRGDCASPRTELDRLVALLKDAVNAAGAAHRARIPAEEERELFARRPDQFGFDFVRRTD